MKEENFDLLKSYIRDIPDFPKKGIIFKDITTLLKDPYAFKKSIDIMYSRYKNKKINKVIAIESRGFIFAGALAYKLEAGFVPVRKKGKLPAKTLSVSYTLEYGTDILQMHCDAIEKGENVLLVDDLLATGGTASAVTELIKNQGGNIIEIAFLIELTFLHGIDKLKDYEVFSIIKY